AARSQPARAEPHTTQPDHRASLPTPEASAETDRRHYGSASPPPQATPEAKAPTPQPTPATPAHQKPERRETPSRQYQPEPAETAPRRRYQKFPQNHSRIKRYRTHWRPTITQ